MRSRQSMSFFGCTWRPCLHAVLQDLNVVWCRCCRVLWSRPDQSSWNASSPYQEQIGLSWLTAHIVHAWDFKSFVMNTPRSFSSSVDSNSVILSPSLIAYLVGRSCPLCITLHLSGLNFSSHWYHTGNQAPALQYVHSRNISLWFWDMMSDFYPREEDALDNWRLRRILHIHWTDFVSNDVVRSRTGQPLLSDTIRQRRLSFFGLSNDVGVVIA